MPRGVKRGHQLRGITDRLKHLRRTEVTTRKAAVDEALVMRKRVSLRQSRACVRAQPSNWSRDASLCHHPVGVKNHSAAPPRKQTQPWAPALKSSRREARVHAGKPDTCCSFACGDTQVINPIRYHYIALLRGPHCTSHACLPSFSTASRYFR